MTRNKSRPNILLIMSDEHDPGVTGCYGDKIVETPNIDLLSKRGVTFDNCYTPSPLCAPARLSFTAGKYSSRCRVWSNDCWLPSEDYPSLPRILNATGYESILGGKMHYDVTRRYGFRDLFPSKPHQNSFFKTGKGDRRSAADQSVIPDESWKSWKTRIDSFHAGDHSWILDLDREVTTECSRFLKERKPEDKPFFLLAGYVAPHFPLTVPEKYFQKYQGRIPMPNIPDGLMEKLPKNYQHLRKAFGIVNALDEDIKKGRELYWGLVNWMDDQIGLLLNALEDSEVADNTVVIYTSDHGENKGDHGLWWKNCMYDHATRIPLIISWPNRLEPGQRRQGACSLLDLGKTIAEIAGADIPQDWDGDSMLAWLENENADWKDMAVSEYFAHNIVSGFIMYRHRDFKYVYHTRMDDTHGPEQELYNLKEDPNEFVNLASQPDFRKIVEEMHAGLVEELGSDPEELESQCRSDYEKGYGRKVQEELTKDDPLYGLQ